MFACFLSFYFIYYVMLFRFSMGAPLSRILFICLFVEEDHSGVW